jgi:hypothetical protein
MSEQTRRDTLRARLRAEPNKLPEELRRLGKALWAEGDAPLTHDECRAALPALVMAQVAGEPVTEFGPRVLQHLDACETCGAEYADLLETEWAAQRGELAVPQTIPPPDLRFLPRRTPLEATVVAWARAALSKLDPAQLPGLEKLADGFFAPLKPMEAHEARAAYGTDDTEAEKGTTLRVVKASYNTLQALVTTVTPEEYARWHADAQVKEKVQARANAAAREAGLDQESAVAFAAAVADEIAHEPQELERLLTA